MPIRGIGRSTAEAAWRARQPRAPSHSVRTIARSAGWKCASVMPRSCAGSRGFLRPISVAGSGYLPFSVSPMPGVAQDARVDPDDALAEPEILQIERAARAANACQDLGPAEQAAAAAEAKVDRHRHMSSRWVRLAMLPLSSTLQRPSSIDCQAAFGDTSASSRRSS